MVVEEKKIISATLNIENHSTLCLWCAVNKASKRAQTNYLLEKWCAEVDIKHLQRRLNSQLQEQWEHYKVGKHFVAYKQTEEGLKKFREQKRRELQAVGIDKEIVSICVNKIQP